MTKDTSCLAQTTTKLQRHYCTLLTYDQAARLPTIDDFKKNSDVVQQLLLKQEARRLGVTLPEVTQIKETKANTKIEQSVEKDNENTIDNNALLTQCTLNKRAITCPKTYYTLVNNLKNNQLKASAFSSHNTLALPRKHMTEFKDESDYRYLSHIYPNYIYKMLELGLGDSTMSFTKFATVYWQSKLDKQDFTKRFAFMYNQLKIEKSRNVIKARYRDNYPENIRQCMRLDAYIIVCDDMKQNWIYRLK